MFTGTSVVIISQHRQTSNHRGILRKHTECRMAITPQLNKIIFRTRWYEGLREGTLPLLGRCFGKYHAGTNLSLQGLMLSTIILCRTRGRICLLFQRWKEKDVKKVKSAPRNKTFFQLNENQPKKIMGSQA